MKYLNISMDVLIANANTIKELIAKMNNKTISPSEYQELQKRLIRHYSIQNILLRLGYLKKGDEYFNNYPVCEYKLNGNKVLFISDTHFGHDKQNLEYIDEVKSFASNNGIKSIIHAGDFVEGMSRKYKEMWKLSYEERYDILEKEIREAKSNLPKGIKTNLLLGNHDFSIIQACPKLVDNFFDQDNLFILGLGRVVINWNDLTPIVISHPINSIAFKEQPIEEAITIKGHSHAYYVDSSRKTIYIPTLSDDSREKLADLSFYGITFKENGNRPKPLFVSAEITSEETILFREYYALGKEQPKETDEIEYNIKSQKMSRIRKKYY